MEMSFYSVRYADGATGLTPGLSDAFKKAGWTLDIFPNGEAFGIYLKHSGKTVEAIETSGDTDFCSSLVAGKAAGVSFQDEAFSLLVQNQVLPSPAGFEIPLNDHDPDLCRIYDSEGFIGQLVTSAGKTQVISKEDIQKGASPLPPGSYAKDRYTERPWKFENSNFTLHLLRSTSDPKLPEIVPTGSAPLYKYHRQITPAWDETRVHVRYVDVPTWAVGDSESGPFVADLGLEGLSCGRIVRNDAVFEGLAADLLVLADQVKREFDVSRIPDPKAKEAQDARNLINDKCGDSLYKEIHELDSSIRRPQDNLGLPRTSDQSDMTSYNRRDGLISVAVVGTSLGVFSRETTYVGNYETVTEGFSGMCKITNLHPYVRSKR
jgi:hypothetical protein